MGEIRKKLLPWEDSYKLLLQFIYQDTNIGKWIGTQRATYKRDKLSRNRIDLLNEINLWKW